jgi:hypothetical protein
MSSSEVSSTRQEFICTYVPDPIFFSLVRDVAGTILGNTPRPRIDSEADQVGHPVFASGPATAREKDASGSERPGRPYVFRPGPPARKDSLMKFTTILLSGFLSLALGSAAFAQSANGTANSTIGSKGAATGTNGSLHSSTNAGLNGSHKGLNGEANSTIGSAGAHAGANGSLHSSTNKALNTGK